MAPMSATVPSPALATGPRQRPATVPRSATVPRPARVLRPAIVLMLASELMPAKVLRSTTVRPCYCKASEGTEVRSSVWQAQGEEEAMASFVFSDLF